jgi:hypothetical protein
LQLIFFTFLPCCFKTKPKCKQTAENPPEYGKTYVGLKRLKLTQICQV